MVDPRLDRAAVDVERIDVGGGRGRVVVAVVFGALAILAFALVVRASSNEPVAAPSSTTTPPVSVAPVTSAPASRSPEASPPPTTYRVLTDLGIEWQALELPPSDTLPFGVFHAGGVLYLPQPDALLTSTEFSLLTVLDYPIAGEPIAFSAGADVVAVAIRTGQPFECGNQPNVVVAVSHDAGATWTVADAPWQDRERVDGRFAIHEGWTLVPSGVEVIANRSAVVDLPLPCVLDQGGSFDDLDASTADAATIERVLASGDDLGLTVDERAWLSARFVAGAGGGGQRDPVGGLWRVAGSSSELVRPRPGWLGERGGAAAFIDPTGGGSAERSVDGGRSWQRLERWPELTGRQSFMSRADDGKYAYSADGGTSWTELPSVLDMASVLDVAVSSDEVLALGRGGGRELARLRADGTWARGELAQWALDPDVFAAQIVSFDGTTVVLSVVHGNADTTSLLIGELQDWVEAIT